MTEDLATQADVVRLVMGLAKVTVNMADKYLSKDLLDW